MLKRLHSQTAEEKRAGFAGLNLFFSVVLGVNLASLGSLPIRDYAALLFLLAGAVTALCTLAVSKRSWMIWTTLAVFAAIVWAILFDPEFRVGPDADDAKRLAITFGAWAAMIAAYRLTPTIAASEPAPTLPPADSSPPIA